MEFIEITGAREHNLQNINLRIPRNAMVVITGVSGSGKSSLAFDTLHREGHYRFLSSLSSYARHYMGKRGSAQVDRLTGLSPSLCMDQKTVVRNPRSTVGTLSDINSYLRLLFARTGKGSGGRNSSCFSFNSPSGACSVCKGLGVEDRIDPGLLIANNSKSIRQGALKITTPTGYLVYSQVTLDVLNQVCQAHGFDIDIPWRDLTDAQRDIVLNGSQRIQIAYGKHPLENRLKWNGITAKPREKGYYKGILPVMEDILKRDRNKNILRFARSVTCRHCHGSRLKPESLAVELNGCNIAQVLGFTIKELGPFLNNLELDPIEKSIADDILEDVFLRLDFMKKLGLSYLTLDRESTQLGGGEAQRLRLVQQASNQLQGVLWVLDEPSVGLHPTDRTALLDVLRGLCELGNTVVIVEHDEETMRQADWIVDIGPSAGGQGGQVIFSGTPEDFLKQQLPQSPTWNYLKRNMQIGIPSSRRTGRGQLTLSDACLNNLNHVNATIQLAAMNVVTGISGAGKATLVHGVLVPTLNAQIKKEYSNKLPAQIHGHETITGLIEMDQSPIGKTPRSNPATYLNVFDEIRDLFSKTTLATERGFGKSHFSFNTKGGRCETCEGTGIQKLGMHFLADTAVICESCNGKRFKDDVLEVTFQGHNIFQVLELTITEAVLFFKSFPKVLRSLHTLQDIGLGYLKLGQPSSTLSGGEAQRIKLAAHLVKPNPGHVLYILNEPTTGLHSADIQVLLNTFAKLINTGHTLVIIEHNLDIIKSADWVIDVGPGSGAQGGNIVIEGTPEQVARHDASKLAPFLATVLNSRPLVPDFKSKKLHSRLQVTRISDASTHNLKHVDVCIQNPSLTVVTGVSGSGKSSLVFDTLYAESRRLFFQALSTQTRRHLKQLPKPSVGTISGLSPSIAMGQGQNPDHPRSLVATASGLDPLLRLLYARFSKGYPLAISLLSNLFSSNHHLGACPACQGLGFQRRCDPEKLVTHPNRSLFDGAMQGTRTGLFYGDPEGQYLAVLKQVGQAFAIDFDLSWASLGQEARILAMEGTGSRIWKASWVFNRKGRKGIHELETRWPGFCGHVNREYQRVHADHRGHAMLPLMKESPCPECEGQRLNKSSRMATFSGVNLPAMMDLTIHANLSFFCSLTPEKAGISQARFMAATGLFDEIRNILQHLSGMGLAYLSLNRTVSTLSIGERQRLRLASALAGDMCGVTYILDEPSRGLHHRDSRQLIQKIHQLRDQGNTIVVVEHDEGFINAADDIIDMGPGSGKKGGQVVFQGNLKKFKGCSNSLTSAFLTGRSRRIPLKKKAILENGLVIRNARAHFLNIPLLEIPAKGMVCITGVSGSGKTSLLFDVIYQSHCQARAIQCDGIDGFERFAAVHKMDQKPLSVSPQSNPLTFCDLFNDLKELYAKQGTARTLGFGSSFFSPFSNAGRCEDCLGLGQQKIELGFLSDLWVPCDRCQGRQFKADILKVTYQGHSIYDLLQLTISEAVDVLVETPLFQTSLVKLVNLGLGHLKMGQSIPTLSSGEGQRLKLARTLFQSQYEDRPQLFLLDEPTNGLHFQDTYRLLEMFSELVNQGHTVYLIEHNLDMIRASDWVIDLGPEGGPQGGEVIFTGVPEDLATCATSFTGQCLSDPSGNNFLDNLI